MIAVTAAVACSDTTRPESASDGRRVLADIPPATPVCDYTYPDARTMSLVADCWTDTTLYIPNNFTFEGNGHVINVADPVAGHFTGAVLEALGDSANVYDVTIRGHDMFNIPMIYVENLRPGHGTAHVSVFGKTIERYIKHGIGVFGNVSAKVEQNTIIGWGLQPLQLQYSIEMSGVPDGLIARNTITGGNRCDGDGGDWGGAIISDSGSHIVYRKNVVSGSQIGIRANKNVNAVIDSNTVTGPARAVCPSFISPGDPCSFGIWISGSGNVVNDNDVTSVDYGIYLGHMYFHQTVSNTTGTRNSFTHVAAQKIVVSEPERAARTSRAPL
ncbi:MAG: right-handed parallel beta-helix repeat-containing protein [Gemmatimonadota bacterium]|nr:right-handed parallel beta-helix repeat-containing protein [Gemmatimonadota bacterium]